MDLSSLAQPFTEGGLFHALPLITHVFIWHCLHAPCIQRDKHSCALKQVGRGRRSNVQRLTHAVGTIPQNTSFWQFCVHTIPVDANLDAISKPTPTITKEPKFAKSDGL